MIDARLHHGEHVCASTKATKAMILPGHYTAEASYRFSDHLLPPFRLTQPIPLRVNAPFIMQSLRNSLALARFYLQHLPTLYNLPLPLKNPDILARNLADGGRHELKVRAAVAKDYNDGLQALAATLRSSSSLSPPSPNAFRQNLFLFFTLRILCCAAALSGSSWLVCIAAASLQFLLLPYSFFVAATQFIALFPALFSGHICVHLPLQLLADYLFPSLPSITITPTFIIVFFALDFIQAVDPPPPPLSPIR